MSKITNYQRNWILYNLLVAFAFYWLSNVILWYPWSYSTGLGMTIMLTVNPIIWGYAIYNCLVRYQGESPIKSAIWCGLSMVIVSAIADYIFFGLIRGAMTELYHPTTFYGYAFIFCLPFIEILVFKKLIAKNKRELTKNVYIKMAALGIVCAAVIAVIIIFDLNITQ